MKLLHELNRSDFELKFSDKRSCLEYLSERKWNTVFKCRKCGYQKYNQGKQLLSRRCGKCTYDESVTANTLFHQLKIDLVKAFGMLYDICTTKKGANSIWLAERYGIQQKSAWLFRKKLQSVMKSSGKYPLEFDVHVDEFEIGTPQKGEQGRSKSDKKMRVVVAFEHRNGKSGRGYAKVINDYSSDSLKPIFDEHISKTASVLADKWKGYAPLKGEYKVEQILSDKGQNFKMLHIQIRNFKNWIRGVHSYCNREYLQQYLDEYFFRFNRRNHRTSIIDKICERIVQSEPFSVEKN